MNVLEKREIFHLFCKVKNRFITTDIKLCCVMWEAAAMIMLLNFHEQHGEFICF